MPGRSVAAAGVSSVFGMLHSMSIMRTMCGSLFLQLQVFERRRVEMARNQSEAGLRHARTDAIEERHLEEREVEHLVVHELLDLVERRFALLAVHHAALLVEQAVDVRMAAVREHALALHERLDARGGVAV